MTDSPPPSSSSTLYSTDIPSAGNYSGHPVDASNVDAQNGPAFPMPTFHSAPRMTKHTIMGIRTAEGHSQRANDPFDYEQKYPEDEEYQEMGPMARIWKVFLDECGKFDTEMVENWRDALDVLLVFAGLFSAVVTTFVSQTCQNLQPDFQEINASKMNEVSELIRAAILNGTEGILSIPRSSNTAASFRPSLSALWVNGLWFTSLALSLTTALIAVLTKQWIHQYMSVPSGTPRDRSRIRQFRYMSLQQWQVPVIIGLLPVLMHVALGVFFAGLTIFLCSLNTAIAGVIGFIAAAAFGVYITTNLLPLFKAGCPYKTPLTLHSHSFARFLRCRLGQLKSWFTSPDVPQDPVTYEDFRRQRGRTIPAKEPASLKTLEKERVDSDASNIDVQCLSWLYNASSNPSVQRVIMQAVGNLPLQDTSAIHHHIPSIMAILSDTMTSIEERAAERPTYERLFRALSRFEGYELPFPFGGNPDERCLSLLAHKDRAPQAAQFLRIQIVKSTVKMDILSWALVLANALNEGAAWLDVNVADSNVWQALVPYLLSAHRCSRSNCDESRQELVTLTVRSGLKEHALTILDTQNLNSSEAFTFLYAIERFMFPSLTELVLEEYQHSSMQRFDIPSDLALHLSLMTSPSVRAAPTWTAELSKRIESYAGILSNCDTLNQHSSIAMPMFHALLDVVCAHDFVGSSLLTLGQKMDACLFLLQTFHLDPELQRCMGPFLTPSILQKILRIAFSPSPRLPSPLIIDILKILTLRASPLITDVYGLLRRREWLEEILEVLSSWPETKIPLERREYFYDLTYPFLACAYVNGLEVLKYSSPSEYEETLGYLTPSNLLRISELVLLADTVRRQSLRNLAKIVGNARWTMCGKDLSAFLESQDGHAAYEHHAHSLRGQDPLDHRIVLSYGTYNDLKALLKHTMDLSVRAEQATGTVS